MNKALLIFTFVLALAPATILAQQKTAPAGIEWLDFDVAIAKAEEDGKQILVFGMADWCPYCRQMLREVYTDSTVQHAISEYFHPVKLDSDSDRIITYDGSEISEQELAAHFGLHSLPTHYFMNSEWIIFGQQPGFLPVEIFRPMLEYVGTGAYKELEFDQFIKSGAGQ